MDRGTSDNISSLTSDRDRLLGEIQTLVGSIAMGQGQPASMVEAIRERELEITRIEARLRAPRCVRAPRSRSMFGY